MLGDNDAPSEGHAVLSPGPSDGAAPTTPRRSPRKAAEAERAAKEMKALKEEMKALAKLPWCGQAEKLGPSEAEILTHYEHRVVEEPKLIKGELVMHPIIKYHIKYEAAGAGAKERTMSMRGLNATRMGEALLSSEKTPINVKEAVARKMRSSAAKAFMSELESKRRAETAAMANMNELDMARKRMKPDGSAHAKEEERKGVMDRYVAKDPPMPPELFGLCLHYMSVFFIMCRIPFFVSTNTYFLRFLWSLRPAFVKKLPSASEVSSSSSAAVLLYA